jgi:hypothetical protein
VYRGRVGALPGLTGTRSATTESEMDVSDQVQAMLDRDAVRECLIRLARGEDRRDAALISASIWPDAEMDYGVFKDGFPAYLAWVVPGADAITDTQHVLGQSFVELDGAVAKAETQVISYHRVDMGAGERDTCIGGRYLDVLAKRDGAWRIAARTMLYDWYQDWGEAIDWSRGVMGLPFGGPHYPGRSVGDHSVAFFAK